VLIIAHRLKLAQEADLIVLMEGGRAVQMGSPKILSAETGKYSRLLAAYEGGLL